MLDAVQAASFSPGIRPTMGKSGFKGSVLASCTATSCYPPLNIAGKFRPGMILYGNNGMIGSTLVMHALLSGRTIVWIFQ